MVFTPKIFPFHLRLILILFSLFLVILFGLIATLSHFSNQHSKLNEEILNQEFTIKNFPLFAEEYVKQGNRKQLLILKREADHVNTKIEALKKAKIFEQRMGDYPPSFQTADTHLPTGLEEYQKEFLEHYQYVNKLWNYNLSNLRSKHSSLSASDRKEKLNKTLNFLQRRNTTLVRKNRTFRALLKNREALSETKTKWIICISALLCLSGFLYLYYEIINIFLKKLRKEQIKLGQLTNQSTHNDAETLDLLSHSRSEIELRLTNAIEYVNQITKLEFDHGTSSSIENWPLGVALQDMSLSLKSMAEEKEISSWTNEGFSLISDILNKNSTEVDQLTYDFIRFLCNYCNLNQGIVFINTSHNSDIELTFSSCYAYGSQKSFERYELKKEGLIAQVIKEKSPLYLEEIPENYIGITSGLGAAPPRSIMICPLYYNEDFYGTIEVASFSPLNQGYQDFIKNAAEKLSNTLSVFQINQRTKELLTSTKEKNELLQQKEKEMALFAQELQDTQGKLSQKLLELKKESNLTQNIIDAIDKSSATLEFDPQGKILKVNDMFLSIMGYKPTELIGKHESVLVVPSEANSQRYQLMWTGLSSGSFMTGEFKRLTNKGKEIWISATYNPIFDLDGKTIKVIMLANFITEEREKSLDSNLRITAFNNHLTIVELDKNGKMKKANPNFEKLTGYKRIEYRDRPLADLMLSAREMTQLDNKIKKVVDEKELQSHTFNILTKDKKEVQAVISLYPLYNLAQVVVKVMAILSTKQVTSKKSEQENLTVKDTK
ncbi:PAS domain S-box protein [Sediminitomix flava]|uniref:PAS domain S-box-containing protein n=1 Tax=Sediminitomix flava TaxID=379075 RepID=A0A315Z301_SEDFL|nr:PAS domain S-box protein [Sediminitomix flava]PWJ36176.1 PAS domain S-box-containing protein [Sediminitomix flava]